MTTNLQKIRQMTADELAELINTSCCNCCIYENCYKGADCAYGIKQLLEQESEE